MTKKADPVQHAKDAAEALKDLNMFGAIQALCESSLFSSDCFGAEEQIVRICKQQMGKCLDRYDRALARVNARRFHRHAD